MLQPDESNTSSTIQRSPCDIGLTLGQPLFAELRELQSHINQPMLQIQRREAEGQQSTLASQPSASLREYFAVAQGDLSVVKLGTPLELLPNADTAASQTVRHLHEAEDVPDKGCTRLGSATFHTLGLP